jgi:hypothetical protein
VVFPHEIIEVRGFDVHDHGRALQILDKCAIIDARQLLHEHLIEMFSGLFLAALFEEEKILDLLRVDGLVGEVLPEGHHRGEDQNRQGEEREPISPKELHRMFLTGGGGGGNEFQGHGSRGRAKRRRTRLKEGARVRPEDRGMKRPPKVQEGGKVRSARGLQVTCIRNGNVYIANLL